MESGLIKRVLGHIINDKYVVLARVRHPHVQLSNQTSVSYKGAFLLRQSKIGFLNPKESENGFLVSSLDRSIQDLSDRGASKEPKNSLWKWIFSVPLTFNDPKSLRSIGFFGVV